MVTVRGRCPRMRRARLVAPPFLGGSGLALARIWLGLAGLLPGILLQQRAGHLQQRVQQRGVRRRAVGLRPLVFRIGAHGNQTVRSPGPLGQVRTPGLQPAPLLGGALRQNGLLLGGASRPNVPRAAAVPAGVNRNPALQAAEAAARAGNRPEAVDGRSISDSLNRRRRGSVPPAFFCPTGNAARAVSARFVFWSPGPERRAGGSIRGL